MPSFHLWLAALTALRLALAAAVPLAPDEAYYWVWSRALAAGYPDHPPMVALFIRAGTALAGDGAFGVRLLGPLSVAAGSLLLADAGRLLLGDRRAGEAAALLLNATLLVGAGSVAMTPDTPLLLFWTAALWAAARLHTDGRGAWLPLAGLCAGLAMDSKYTAAFLGLGIGLWLLLAPAQRRRLRTPWPWAGALLGALAFAPVLAWNAAHGWASFSRQGGRLGRFSIDRAARFVAELVGGQIGLATPLVFLLFAAGAVAVARRALRGESAPVLLTSLTLPAAAVFAEHALGDRVQANWPAVLYPALALSAASLPGRRRLRAAAAALGFGLTALVYVQASLSPLALSPHVDPTMRQLGGWPELSAQVARLAEGSDFVAADDYGVAAELARGLPETIPVYAIDPRWALFDLPHPDLAGRTGLLVRSERRREEPDAAWWAGVSRIGDAARVRDGVTAEAFRVYRVTARDEPPAGGSVAAMPRPGRP